MSETPQTPEPEQKADRGPLIAGLIVAFLAVGAVAGIFIWLNLQPEQNIEVRITDYESERAAGTMGPNKGGSESIDIEGSFLTFDGQPGEYTTNWPNFRGSDYSNIFRSKVPLADSWPAGGPPVIWEMDISEGHAGAAVYNGRVYLLDYDEDERADALRTFSLSDGKEIWRRWYKVTTKRNHGISRTIPAVTEKYTVTMGPRCHVMCVDTETGEYRWGIDLVKEYDTEVPLWYTGQCPLIDDGIAVIAPGGKALMIGVDCETGEVVWEAKHDKEWHMSHSSIIPMTMQGKRMYVYASTGGIYGVSAEKEDLGTLLWKSIDWAHSVISPSPVRIDDSRIFLTAGYGTGSMMLKIHRDGDSFTPETVYTMDVEQFGCEQQTPILYKGHLFGILPKDAGSRRGQFICMTPEGKTVWTSGTTERFGLGPWILADGKFYILDDTGIMTMIRASLTGYEKLAQERVVPGHDAWAPMALVDGKLILRDSKHMACLDVRAN